MNRRGFLQSILAASVAPAFVPSSSLMLLIPRRIESGSEIDLSGTIYVNSLKAGEVRPIQDGKSWATAFAGLGAAFGTPSVIKGVTVLISGGHIEYDKNVLLECNYLTFRIDSSTREKGGVGT